MPDGQTGTPGFRFDNSYARLPDRFYARLDPAPVPKPGLLAVNGGLARELGLDPEALASDAGLAVLAGNAVPDGAEPLAMAYAGHQFGGWVPQLGDGRAILLGEVIGPDGRRRDIQLKGSGRTPFSRMGDGRAWVGPVIREYLVSEAMHGLGIPTTRALAAVTTGDRIARETWLPGAVLTRVAASHVRVGTFQYFAARGDTEALRLLADHVIARHYPDLGGAGTPALALLGAVTRRQAELVAAWMAVGFIHGVMNTDNMSVAGETIDYGPCAFMDVYHPETVFSSIDQFGRYAYANQPVVAHWNLAQLASSLLPLIDPDPERKRGIAEATEAIGVFPEVYEAAWAQRFTAKIGLPGGAPEDVALVRDLLDRMTAARADFTLTFRSLSGLVEDGAFPPPAAATPEALDPWLARWRARLAGRAGIPAALEAANPEIIPRNHQVEAAIAAAVAGDTAPFHKLADALAAPYETRPGRAAYTAPPKPAEVVHQTFCGT